MKKKTILGIGVVLLLLAGALPASAGHFRANIWVGPGWGPRWYGPPHYYYYPYYPDPPTVIVQPPPDVYYYPAPAQPAPQPQQAAPPQYWYYCREPQGYYPYVNTCPGGWQKVAPTPPDQKE